MNQSNLNVNNARRMTPQAARVFLKNAKFSTFYSKGKRGLLLFYILLLTTMTPQVEAHVGTRALNYIRGAKKNESTLFTQAQKNAAGAAAKQAAIIAGGYTGGTAGASGVLLAQIRGDPKIQYALLMIGISMFLYRYMSMRMAANARRHEAAERDKNRAHSLALINKQQEFFMKMIEKQQEAIPNIVMGLLQGRDPSIAGLIANR